MNISPDEFMTLQGGMSAKDVRIAQLEEQVAQLTKERDLWQARALAAGGVMPADKGEMKEGRLVVSVRKLKEMLAKIKDVKIVSVIGMILQKALTRESSAGDCKLVADIVPLPSSPSLTVTADGDVKVEGNWNDVHDNGTVNF